MDIDTDIRATAAGNQAAFARIVEAYQHRLFGYLGRMGLDRATAEDIAQETLLRVWRNAGRFDPRLSSLATWILTIARNLALNHLSRPMRRSEITMGEAPVDIRSDLPLPDEAYAAKQRQARLQVALSHLSPADRSLLAASYVEGLDLTEIARIEACSPGAAKVRLHRARNRLRQLLENDDG